jgi:hypothetical protein
MRHHLVKQVQQSINTAGALKRGSKGREYELSRYYPLNLLVFRRKALAIGGNRD